MPDAGNEDERTAMTPEIEAVLDRLVSDARRMADTARETAKETDALLRELRQARE